MNNQLKKVNPYTGALFIMALLYFIFGFVTWLNGILIPFLKLTCNLNSDAKAFLVTFAFFIAYFVLALPSSWILEKTGFKNGMSLGLATMAVGAVVFIPAAETRSFNLFLVGLFIQGMGLALLQTAVNPYVSILGPHESAATRISVMGIFNKLAGIAAPLVFGQLLLGNAAEISKKVEATADIVEKDVLLVELSGRVVVPYLVITAVLLALAAALRFVHLPEIQGKEEESDDDTSVAKTAVRNHSFKYVRHNRTTAAKTSIFQFPHVLLGALAIFFYVGAEVMAGDLIGTYGRNLGFSLDQTRYFTTLTLSGMLIGYLLSLAIIPKYVKQENWLNVSAIFGIILTFAAYLTEGSVAITCIAALGFANAVMWPAIFPLGIAGLGKFTKTGSALLIMGIAGGAIVPQIYGQLAEVIPFETAFLLTMLPCYLYILYFAKIGHKVGKS